MLQIADLYASEVPQQRLWDPETIHPGVSIAEKPGHKSVSGTIGSEDANAKIDIETVSGNVKFSD